jgi:hypothetical protein
LGEIVPKHNGKPSKPVRKDPLIEAGDPALRLVSWLIQNKDFRQLEQRTGIHRPPYRRKRVRGKGASVHTSPLPVLLQLDPGAVKPRLFSLRVRERYEIPLAYQAAMTRNEDVTSITARLPLGSAIFGGSVNSLVRAVTRLQKLGVKRISLGAPGQPSREREAGVELGLPGGRKYKRKRLSGEGVIVGIIDDGCAFAHCDFLKRRVPGGAVKSRILYLWDQAGTGNASAGWQPPADFYGLELDQKAINAALNANRIGDLVLEDEVYRKVGYRIGDVATHGTHVMDIAAGNGQSLMGVRGVAPGADIIFVQLPAYAIEGGARATLWRYIADGAAYIFERAKKAQKPAVVNISYGGYDGPHDGTSQLEQRLDQMLLERERAVVLAAGNGFEARCHARKRVPQNRIRSLRWIISPHDPTANDLEIWYQNTSILLVRLRKRGTAITPSDWVPLDQAPSSITRVDGKAIGRIEHLASDTGNGANRILITLNATDAAAEVGNNAPAPSGVWTVQFKHVGGVAAELHAWIWRDDAGRARYARRRQSRFHPDNADPAHTIAGWATGHRTISVGAYNTATREICRYSACGPTRPIGGQAGRPKPDVYAPAEEDARGRGVLSASALSTRPSRMNGTSASAPHVAGLIALILEEARKNGQKLNSDQIRQKLAAGATFPADTLNFNRHQKVDARVKIKQKAVQAELRSSRRGVPPK